MKAVLTLEGGGRITLDILRPPTWLLPRHLLFWEEFEREFVRNWNLSQPHMLHKAVRAHITRN